MKQTKSVSKSKNTWSLPVRHPFAVAISMKMHSTSERMYKKPVSFDAASLRRRGQYNYKVSDAVWGWDGWAFKMFLFMHIYIIVLKVHSVLYFISLEFLYVYCHFNHPLFITLVFSSNILYHGHVEEQFCIEHVFTMLK